MGSVRHPPANNVYGCAQDCNGEARNAGVTVRANPMLALHSQEDEGESEYSEVQIRIRLPRFTPDTSPGITFTICPLNLWNQNPCLQDLQSILPLLAYAGACP